MADSTDAKYSLAGGSLYVSLDVGGAPPGLSFGFRLIGPVNRIDVIPPHPESGRDRDYYRLPGDPGDPDRARELKMMNGLSVECDIYADAGDGADPTADFFVWQRKGQQLVECGQVEASFKPDKDDPKIVRATPRLKLVGE